MDDDDDDKNMLRDHYFKRKSNETLKHKGTHSNRLTRAVGRANGCAAS